MDKEQQNTCNRVQMLADAGYYPRMKDETDVIFSDGDNEVRLSINNGSVRSMKDKKGNNFQGKLEDFLTGNRNEQVIQ